MEPSRGSSSNRTHDTRNALSSQAVHPKDRAAETRLLKVGFGLYLETGDGEGVAGSGLATDGHPIFEYLFPRPVGDS